MFAVQSQLKTSCITCSSHLLAVFVIGFLLITVSPLSKADEIKPPAVSEPNGKISLQGSLTDGNKSGIARGAFALPLGHSFGAQIDAATGMRGKIGGLAGHLFWRDPGSGLLGFYADHMIFANAEVSRMGVEADLYLKQLSIEGLVGYEEAQTKDGLFTRAALAYYPENNFRLSIEHRYSKWRDGNWGGLGHSMALNAEHQISSANERNVSLFAEARFGEECFDAFSIGLKIYFGGSKSLIRRHREDDPKIHLDALGARETKNDAAPAQALTAADCMAMGGFVLINGQCVPLLQEF